jgi:hypothetical protein
MTNNPPRSNDSINEPFSDYSEQQSREILSNHPRLRCEEGEPETIAINAHHFSPLAVIASFRGVRGKSAMPLNTRSWAGEMIVNGLLFCLFQQFSLHQSVAKQMTQQSTMMRSGTLPGNSRG